MIPPSSPRAYRSSAMRAAPSAIVAHGLATVARHAPVPRYWCRPRRPRRARSISGRKAGAPRIPVSTSSVGTPRAVIGIAEVAQLGPFGVEGPQDHDSFGHGRNPPPIQPIEAGPNSGRVPGPCCAIQPKPVELVRWGEYREGSWALSSSEAVHERFRQLARDTVMGYTTGDRRRGAYREPPRSGPAADGRESRSPVRRLRCRKPHCW